MKYIDSWTAHNVISLNVQELMGTFLAVVWRLLLLNAMSLFLFLQILNIEIIQSVVPKTDLSKFRSLKYLNTFMGRAGFRDHTELTGDGFQKIIEEVLEMKPTVLH